jgi:hypothetical protein
LQTNKARIFAILAAWTLVVFGVIAILIAVTEQFQPDTIARLESGGYFKALLFRTIASYYQLVLLSGWIALMPHALWFYWQGYRYRLHHDDYRQFTFEAQTLFTSLGFLGTIVGISLAVAGLADAMKVKDPAGLIDGLSVAFDTTFLGLGAAITLIVLRQIIPEREIPDGREI